MANRHFRRLFKAVCEGLPGFHGKDDTEVWDGHVVAVDGIVMLNRCVRRRLVMRDDLVAEEVEVDPLLRAAALGTAEDGAVEVARGGEIVDGKGVVERGERQYGLRGAETILMVSRPIARGSGAMGGAHAP